MESAKIHQRKLLNFSVNRGMQLQMIFRISLILFCCLLIVSAVYFQMANQEIGASFKMFHVKARTFLDMLLPVVLASSVVSLICGVVASLFFPKNYAGALYRVESDLKNALDSGDLSISVRLRDGDPATSLADGVNALLGDLRTRVGGAQQALKALERLCEREGDIRRDDLTAIREQLRDQIGGLKI